MAKRIKPMETPLLSIIVPVYNAGKAIDRCVQSILSQSETNFELILVDDGSTDGSGEICDSWFAKDKRIKVLHSENFGQSHARNMGIDMAVGKYITFVDSDDYLYDKDSLNYTVKCMREDQSIDIVQFPYKGIGWLNQNEGIHCNKGCGSFNGGSNALEHFGVEGLGEEIYPAPWAKVYRAHLFKRLRFPEGMIFEDSYLLTDMLQIIDNLCIIDRGGYAYVCNSSGTMAGGATKKKSLDQLVSHLHTLEACHRLKIDSHKYSRFYSVIFYDVYCAVVHFKQNIFPKPLLDKLSSLSPKLQKNLSLKIRTLILIAKLMGYNSFFNLMAKLKGR